MTDTPAPAPPATKKKRGRTKTPKNQLTAEKSTKLLNLLCEAQTDILDLAAQEKLSYRKLTSWANDQNTQSVLAGICRLNDLRAQLLVTRYRTLAAARLFELAKDDAAGETARKACVDLLNATLITPLLHPHSTQPDPESAPPVSVEELSEFLNTLGNLDQSTTSPAESKSNGDSA